MSTKIKKAKVKSNRTLEVEFIEFKDDGSQNLHTIKGNQLAHDDLLKTFANLVFHLLFICDLKESSIDTKHEGFDPENYPNLKVNQFSIGGDSDSEGVTIVGSKKINNKILNLTAPFQKYDDEEYNHCAELAEDLQACMYEVREYLFNGKYALKQEEISFEDDEKTGAEILAEQSDDDITDVDFEETEEHEEAA